MVYAKHLPTAIAAVETAVPCFIGFTERDRNEKLLRYKPTLISSQNEYESIFGGMPSVKVLLLLDKNNQLKSPPTITPSPFLLPFSIQHYFQNGGGPCYVISVGSYIRARMNINLHGQKMMRGLKAAAKEEKITLIILPDDSLLQNSDARFTLLKETLKQCAELRDRFAILDAGQPPATSTTNTIITAFRNGIGNEHLQFGAAYFPWLRTTLPPFIRENDAASLRIKGGTKATRKMILKDEDEDRSLFHNHKHLYDAVMMAVNSSEIILPPCAAVAGIYAATDRQRGVWKAPANVSLAAVKAPVVTLTNQDNEQLNVDPATGKSINAIRAFTGKGVLVWGARTLAGNDNEWRYIPVKRLMMMVEESVKKATGPFVFEPNDANTWIKIKGLVENFLLTLWRNGALQGSKPGEAFFVQIGQGLTMSIQDIQEGRMILEIGLAVVRPAEFIILRIIHHMHT